MPDCRQTLDLFQDPDTTHPVEGILPRELPPAATDAPAAGEPCDADGGAVVRTIPLERIRPHPDDPRLQVRDEAHWALVASLREVGQDRTIGVSADGGHYRLWSGSRIWYAAADAGLTHLRAEVHPPATRLDELRRMARSETHECPISAFERARLAGAMRDALREDLGRDPTTRELAAELSLATGTVSERLRVADSLTAEVTRHAGVTPEQMIGLSHTRLHNAARRGTEDERAAWLYQAVHGRFPTWWQEGGEAPQPARPRRFVAELLEGGGFRAESPPEDKLNDKEAMQLYSVLQRVLDPLERRVSRIRVRAAQRATTPKEHPILETNPQTKEEQAYDSNPRDPEWRLTPAAPNLHPNQAPYKQD